MIGHSKENFEYEYLYRQMVIDNIIELYTSGDISALFLPNIIVNNKTALFKSAIYLFGGWENAICSAGVGVDCIRRIRLLFKDYWSEDNILEQLRTLLDSRFDLSIRFIRHVYPELYHAAVNKMNFGSWSGALASAGINASVLKMQSHKFWTRERILKTIHDYNKTYGNIQSDYIRSMNSSLYSNTTLYFKTWSQAVSNAGLDLEKNRINAMLTPFRKAILIKYIRKIYDLQLIKHQIIENALVFQTTNSTGHGQYGHHGQQSKQDKHNYNSPNSPPTNQLDSTGRTQLHLELLSENNRSIVTVSFRAWSPELDKEIYEILTNHPRVIVYYLIGEPREWLESTVEFINVDSFYPFLEEAGRDELIADLSLMARGGIPETYQTEYSNYFKSIKNQLIEKKSE
jgi:hypothetical protein